jgi:hypothetical protein
MEMTTGSARKAFHLINPPLIYIQAGVPDGHDSWGFFDEAESLKTWRYRLIPKECF